VNKTKPVIFTKNISCR